MRPTFDWRPWFAFFVATVASAVLVPIESIATQKQQDAEYSDAELNAAKERRQKEVADIRELIRALEKQRKIAVKDPKVVLPKYDPTTLLASDGINIEPESEHMTELRRAFWKTESSESRKWSSALNDTGTKWPIGSQPSPLDGPQNSSAGSSIQKKSPPAKKYANYADQYFDLRIQAAKEDLAAVAKMKLAVFAAIERLEKPGAAELLRASDADERRIEEWKAKQAEEHAGEDEAVILSGNCPIRPLTATFAHLDAAQTREAFNDAFGPSTAIYFAVRNRAKSQVIAWEVEYELLDGFDEVIASGTHKLPAIDAQTKDEAFFAVRQVPEAVQMTIYTRRAKLEDGTLWERLPEHGKIGCIVKKLEGADLIN
jgi:hypothetical protein